jgi:hypothetical protein
MDIEALSEFLAKTKTALLAHFTKEVGKFGLLTS